MPRLFVNPKLPDYFIEAPEVTSSRVEKSYIPEYEAGKVIALPNLKFDIDFDFWGNIDLPSSKIFKKFSGEFSSFDENDADKYVRSMVKSEIDEKDAIDIVANMRSVYEQIMPIYKALFSGYEFSRHKMVWRLNTIMNENMHIDTYKEENELHFARMFVNLDNQPRIWQTSWSIDEICAMAAGKISREKLETMTRGELWAELNKVTFGGSSLEWWDNQPRHACYFDPGDVWLVDSRQISHQIFYGRRALSIDFSMPREVMQRPERHYLNMAEEFRNKNLGLQTA